MNDIIESSSLPRISSLSSRKNHCPNSSARVVPKNDEKYQPCPINTAAMTAPGRAFVPHGIHGGFGESVFTDSFVGVINGRAVGVGEGVCVGVTVAIGVTT